MWQCLRWEDASYSGRMIRSFALHHTIQGGLPKPSRACVCVLPPGSVSQNSALFKQDIGPRLRWVRLINLNFLSGGGDTDKTLPLFCVCLSITLLFGSRGWVGRKRQAIIHLAANRKATCSLVERNLMYMSTVKTTSITSFEGKYWCWQSLAIPCTMT